MPSGRAERLLRLGGLAASVGLGAAGHLLKGLGSKSVTAALFTRENVERIVGGLTRMRGAALKLGQMVSMQEEGVFPPVVEEIFSRVRDGANYMPSWQLQVILREEWGSDWRERIFSEWEEVPLAAASIGQVHRGRLRETGQEVAVKVQYPGVAKSIVSDLDNLKGILLFSQLLPQGLFLENSIRVAQRELSWECDYQREAFYMGRFRQLLEKAAEDEPSMASSFRVPRVYEELSTGRILMSDYLPGIPINRLSSSDITQNERDRLGERLFWLCLQEIFKWRCMQTDPNWSNFLYDPITGGISLLDFGAARDFDASFISGYGDIIKAAAAQDRSAIIEGSCRLGFLTGNETAQLIDAHVQAVQALGLPFSGSTPYDFGQATEEVTGKVRSLIPTMLNYRLTPPPEESYSLHRKLSGIFLLCTKLRARIDCSKLLTRVLDRPESGDPPNTIG